jgi:hypothetical protein
MSKTIACACACVSLLVSASSKEPERIAELREIFDREQVRAMTPLFENYMKALERERKAAMREDDLEGALAYSKEKKRGTA